MSDSPVPLAPEDTARLTELARACKAAARAVKLYPGGHSAIAATLGRIVQLTSLASLPSSLRVSVLVDTLLMDGKPPARTDPAIAELAGLLHGHLIGELTIHAGGDVEAWRSFLVLLGRSPDQVRDEGGIARLWATTAGRHVEIREIDYSELLREHQGGVEAAWDQVIARCLQGDALQLDEGMIGDLLEIADDSTKLADVIGALDARAAESGRSLALRTAALVRLLRGIVQAAGQKEPDRLEVMVRNITTAIGQLTPDMMVSLLAQREGQSSGAGSGDMEIRDTGDTSGFVDTIVSRISDSTIAGFVARNALADGASIERVAQAFHTLVRDSEQRERLLTLARNEAANSPLVGREGFEELWEVVAQKLITSYSDKPFVSQQYGRELSRTRTSAIEIDQVSDDPPERLASWLGTVATSELRRLDLTLLLDLLCIEEDTQRWSMLMRPVVALLEDLLFVGDFDAATALVDALVHNTRPSVPQERRHAAMSAIDALASGPMMRHIVSHMVTIDDAQFAKIRALCVSLGDVLIGPLAAALSVEDRARPRERLTDILIAFGAVGRREVERLKNSTNATVRCTAVHLLREFGGSEALPELADLLHDNERQVQREAVRAILGIGTDRAYRVIEEELIAGSAQSREAIMQSITLAREEDAAPLFSYLLGHVDHRGQLGWIYVWAIEGLGVLKSPNGVPVLKEGLYRGEWWAPRRTARLRSAAAAALARIGTPEALRVLEEAIHAGPRRVRSVARAHLQASRGAPTAAR